MKHLFWIVPAVLLALFGVNAVITNGIIWVAHGLFNVDWSDKFWMVFVLLIIVEWIVSPKGSSSNG